MRSLSRISVVHARPAAGLVVDAAHDFPLLQQIVDVAAHGDAGERYLARDLVAREGIGAVGGQEAADGVQSRLVEAFGQLFVRLGRRLLMSAAMDQAVDLLLVKAVP